MMCGRSFRYPCRSSLKVFFDPSLATGLFLAEEVGQKGFCFCGLPVEGDQDERVGDDEETEGEEGEEERGGEDGADEDRADDEGPEGHEEEGQDMGMDADADEGAFGGIDEVAACDGLPGVVPAEDAADDEAVGIEAADVGLGGVVAYEEGPVLPRMEIGFEAIMNLVAGQVCREGIFFKEKIFHGNRVKG